MKKLLMASAILALTAGAANAKVWQGNTYLDAAAGYDLKANVNGFCKFGDTGNNGQLITNGVSAVSGASNGGISTAHGDQTFTIDIQNDNDDTVQAAEVQFNFGYAVCNSAFKVTGDAQNGHMKSSATTTDTDFVTQVPYKVKVTYDSIAGAQVTASAAPVDLFTSTQAQAGPVSINFKVDAMDKLLVKGTYTEYYRIDLVPTA